MAEPTFQQRWWGHIGGDDQIRLIAIEAKAHQAFSANQAFLALPSPTQAQTLAQVKLISREMNAISRLLFGDFDDVSDT